MKINKILISNIGAISDANIPIKNGLNIFFGDVKQGKTTILNSIRWVCGGTYPKDILKHGEDDGFIHIFFDDGSTIRREFYMSKSSGVKDRPIQYIKGGVVQSRPVEKIKKLLNPFQLNQNHFTDMNAVEKTRFVVDLFECSTDKEQKELKEIKDEGVDLANQIKAIKFRDVEEVAPVDEDELSNRLKEIKEFNDTQVELSLKHTTLESELEKLSEEEIKLLDRLAEIKAKNSELEAERDELDEEQNPKSTKEVEEQISDAKLTNYKAEKCKEDKKYNTSMTLQMDTLKEERSGAVKRYKAKAGEIGKKLTTLNDSHGIKGLVFTKDGSFTYEKTSPDMLSTSQNAKLSSALQSKYPNTMSVELIDQGESWGHTIYDLIEKAKKENKTIFTTVVGEKPAKVKDLVGVYYVEKGEVKDA